MTAPTSTDHHLADDTKCLHGGCRKPGARHHWGHGFTFCDEHMPTLIDLERGRLVSRRKLGRPGICRDCREFRGIKGRGL